MTAAEMVLSGVGGVGALLVAWLTWRAPGWAVAMVVGSVPLQAYASIGTGSEGTTWTQAWLWCFVATASLLFATGAFSIRLDLVTVLFALVVACYSLTRGQAVDEGRWAAEVYRWGIALAFFVAARGLLAGRAALVPLVLSSAVGGFWTGVVAIVQVIGDVGPASFERAGVSRAYASFGEPNTFGAYAATGAVALSVYLWSGRREQPRWLIAVSVAGAGLAAAGLLLSQSRGAIAAVAVLAATTLLMQTLAWGFAPRLLVAGAVIAGALLIGPRVLDLVIGSSGAVEVDGSSWAEQERRAHWGAAVGMIVASGGRGVGAGQFDQRYREQTPAWRFRIPQGHAHDAYLQAAAEAGLLGGLAYASLIASILAALGARLRRRQRSVPVAIALAVTVVFALHNLVDYLHVLNLPLVVTAWWAAALGQSEGPTRTP